MTKEQEYLMLPARVRKQVIETAADTLERCRTTETNLAGMRELAEAVLRMDAALTEAEARATAEQSSGDQSSDAEQAIRERDEAEEFADRVLDLVLGTDRREWSSAYGRDQALIEVEERMMAVHLQTSGDQEPVAHLWQHSETGRTRIVMPGQVVTMGACWYVVGPLYLHPAPQQAASVLTDAQIDAISESMPGGLSGFLKGWGWRQFARAILAAAQGDGNEHS